MFNGWTDNLLVGIQTLNQILTAGIAVTAFSLFLYSLSFNLRDRVARSFAIILLCVVVVFTTEALQNKTVPNWGIDLLLRLQWLGIVFLPASYLHLSDAVLVTAGRPSRGRRRKFSPARSSSPASWRGRSGRTSGGPRWASWARGSS